MNNYIPSSTDNSPLHRIRISQLHRWKAEGHKWAMLTTYDYLTASIFDAADIPVLLIGDSAANVVYGYDTTVPITIAELLPLVKAVSRGARKALVVADLPFGSYEESPAQAFSSAVLMLKEGGAHAVKLEGGRRIVPHIELLTSAGIPVIGHLGFTPQSVNRLGGFKVQGKSADQAEELRADAHALVAAGVDGIVLEMVPTELAERITQEIPVPIIGIGAGPHTDAQVLVWQDAAGLTSGKAARFVKQYDNLAQRLTLVAKEYASEVAQGDFPQAEHSY